MSLTLKFKFRQDKQHFYYQGSMFSAKLENIFSKIKSTFSNVPIWSCIDDFLLEDFSRISVPRGVYLRKSIKVVFTKYVFSLNYKNKTTQNFYRFFSKLQK